MQTIRPQMPQKMSSDPFLAQTSRGSPRLDVADRVEAGSWTAPLQQSSTFASPTKSSLLKQSASGRAVPSSPQKHKSSPSSAAKHFLSNSISKKVDKSSKPVNLNLNLSSIKKYAGWSGNPGQLPTPLANPPTPLAVPPSSAPTFFSSGAVGNAASAPIAALKLSRSDGKKAGDMLHPFALTSANTPQYMVYNLESTGTTPISPPPTPNSEIGQPVSHVDAVADAQMDICTPPKSVPAPAKEGKGVPIPASAKFLAEHGLAPDFAAQYEILNELGSGGFGFVVRARRRLDGLIVAVKFIFRHKIPSHGWIKIRGWEKLSNGQSDPTERLVPFEAYVLRMIRHRGVVAFLDLLEDEKVFYLVMEHHGSPWVIPERDAANKSAPSTLGASPGLDGLPEISFASDASTSPGSTDGPPTPVSPMPPSKLAPPPMLRRSSCDLFECIEQHSRLPEDQARFVFGQIVDVVHYLSSMGICHRDIKDENIVVDKDFRVKLIDFGSAIIYDPRKPPPYHNRFFGTVNFAASEILQGKAYRAPNAEVWSLGVLLSVLLTGETPFVDPAHAIKGRLARPKAPIPRGAADLMLGCLEVDPDLRFTIQDVRNHPWLAYPSSC